MVCSGDYRVVAIDEGQFFPDLFDHVTRWVDEMDIHVVVVGLDGTFDRTPFGDMLRLLPHAEEVERLTAYCAVCRDGTPAIFSKRTQAGNTTVMAIGGAAMYQPVCRRHFVGT
jgi:thymidine kinase